MFFSFRDLVKNKVLITIKFYFVSSGIFAPLNVLLLKQIFASRQNLLLENPIKNWYTLLSKIIKFNNFCDSIFQYFNVFSLYMMFRKQINYFYFYFDVSFSNIFLLWL